MLKSSLVAPTTALVSLESANPLLPVGGHIISLVVLVVGALVVAAATRSRRDDASTSGCRAERPSAVLRARVDDFDAPFDGARPVDLPDACVTREKGLTRVASGET